MAQESTQFWVQRLEMARMELGYFLVPLAWTFKSWSDPLDPLYPSRHIYENRQACVTGKSFIHSWLWLAGTRS